MILLDLSNYLKTVKKASLLSIASHFDIHVNEARSMLEFLIKKSLVSASKSSCDNCPLSCKDDCPLFYQWLD